MAKFSDIMISGPYEQFWAPWAKFGPKIPVAKRAQNGTTWPRGPRRPKMAQMTPNGPESPKWLIGHRMVERAQNSPEGTQWSRTVHDGLKWPRIAQNGLLDPTWPRGSRIVQMTRKSQYMKHYETHFFWDTLYSVNPFK